MSMTFFGALLVPSTWCNTMSHFIAAGSTYGVRFQGGHKMSYSDIIFSQASTPATFHRRAPDLLGAVLPHTLVKWAPNRETCHRRLSQPAVPPPRAWGRSVHAGWYAAEPEAEAGSVGSLAGCLGPRADSGEKKNVAQRMRQARHHWVGVCVSTHSCVSSIRVSTTRVCVNGWVGVCFRIREKHQVFFPTTVFQ